VSSNRPARPQRLWSLAPYRLAPRVGSATTQIFSAGRPMSRAILLLPALTTGIPDSPPGPAHGRSGATTSTNFLPRPASASANAIPVGASSRFAMSCDVKHRDDLRLRKPRKRPKFWIVPSGFVRGALEGNHHGGT
jgi:hypothetical protein